LLENLGARCRKPIVKSRHHYAMGSVQALEFIGDGQVRGAADPRRDGTAGVLA
jgi:gamma-glutamyltranspeptidase/glutathione hydrolase